MNHGIPIIFCRHKLDQAVDARIEELQRTGKKQAKKNPELKLFLKAYDKYVKAQKEADKYSEKVANCSDKKILKTRTKYKKAKDKASDLEDKLYGEVAKHTEQVWLKDLTTKIVTYYLANAKEYTKNPELSEKWIREYIQANYFATCKDTPAGLKEREDDDDDDDDSSADDSKDDAGSSDDDSSSSDDSSSEDEVEVGIKASCKAGFENVKAASLHLRKLLCSKRILGHKSMADYLARQPSTPVTMNSMRKIPDNPKMKEVERLMKHAKALYGPLRKGVSTKIDGKKTGLLRVQSKWLESDDLPFPIGGRTAETVCGLLRGTEKGQVDTRRNVLSAQQWFAEQFPKPIAPAMPDVEDEKVLQELGGYRQVYFPDQWKRKPDFAWRVERGYTSWR